MIDQGKQRLRQATDLLLSSKINKTKDIDKQSQQQLRRKINNSHKKLNQYAKRQIQLLGPQKLSKNSLQMRNLLSSTQLYKDNDIFNAQKFTKQKIRSLSIMTDIKDVVLKQAAKMIAIQDQINTFDRQLMKTPDQSITIIQFVNNLLQKNKITQMFDMLYQCYQQGVLKQQRKLVMLKPILIKTKQVLQQLKYSINPNLLQSLIFNVNLMPISSSIQQVMVKQQRAIDILIKQNEQLYNNKDFEYSIKQYLMKMVLKKRIVKKQLQDFFEMPQNVDVQEMVSTAIQQQIQSTQVAKQKMFLERQLEQVNQQNYKQFMRNTAQGKRLQFRSQIQETYNKKFNQFKKKRNQRLS